MKINKIIILILITLVLTTGVVAEEYTNIASTTSTDTLWGVSAQPQIVPKLLSNPNLQPLIGDLNGDGNNEVIVADTTAIKIYDATNTTLVGGASISGSATNMLLQDMNGDGNLDIVVEGGNYINYLFYNGTNTNVTTISGAGTGQTNLGCVDGQCVVIHGGSDWLYARHYNVTSLVKASILVTGVGYSWTTYFSDLRHMPLIDSNDNGVDELLFTYFISNSGTRMFSLELTPTDTIVVINKKDISGCPASTSAKVSSPIVGNFDNGFDGDEIIVACGSSTEFHLVEMEKDGTFIDDYPELDDTNGELMSNVIVANVFTDTGTSDFCAMGYDTTNNALNLVCGNPQTSYSFFWNKAINLEYTGAGIYDISRTNAGVFTNKIQAIQNQHTTTDGQDLSEFVTTFGVFEVNYAGDNDLVMQENFGDTLSGLDKGAVVITDYKQDTKADLLYLNYNGLFFVDDGYINTQSVIGSYTVNTGNDVCVGVSPKITIPVSDADNDNINCMISETYTNETIISNLTNQTGVSGNNVVFYYNADMTGTYLLKIYCTDGLHSIPDSEVYQINVVNKTVGNVSTNCNDWGENPTITTVTQTEDETNNLVVTEAIDDALNTFHLNSPLGKLILALILGFVLMLYTFNETKNTGLSIMAGIGTLIIMVALGFLGMWIIVTFFVLALVFIVYAFLKGGRG